MTDDAGDLEALQTLIAQRIEPLGRVVCSVVCRTAYKIVVTDRTGVGVRVLICRDHDSSRPFVNIMPLLDPVERAECDESVSFRGVLLEDVSLDPITDQVKATFERAVSGVRYPPPLG